MSQSSYESDDGEWHPPMHDSETGEMCTDVYGTLSETASTIVSPDGIPRRFLEMIGEKKMAEILLFVDVGCGKGRVMTSVAVASPGLNVLGVDILQEELSVAASAASEHGVADRSKFVICDFRTFTEQIPKEIQPHQIVVYFYLIPKMVSNRELRQHVVDYLERGATMITWSYHATPEWPYLKEEDTTFGIKIFQR